LAIGLLRRADLIIVVALATDQMHEKPPSRSLHRKFNVSDHGKFRHQQAVTES
jgi:hypothetical protein